MSSYRERGLRGVTLIELMIVVVIFGILSTLALTGYRNLINQARSSEAYEFLGAIRAAQNTYFQDYGQYCGDMAWSLWPPGDGAQDVRLNWGEPDVLAWRQLGVRPQGPVWFQYRIRASTNPAAAPANVFTPSPPGPWFQAQAIGNFNNKFYEITSTRGEVYDDRLSQE